MVVPSSPPFKKEGRLFRGNEESKENGYSSGRYAGAERANARREESKKVSFADDTKKSAGQGQDDPVTRHADEDMPDDLCSRSLRTASKSLLLTSIASIFTLCYCVLLAHAGSFPEKGTQGHQGLLVISCLSILVWTTELVIKAAGLGLRQYARNLWNLLDCACLLSLVIDVGIVQGVSFAYLRIFKISRPLQRYQPVAIFQSTIDSICRALKLLPPILGLLGLFILLCAVFGSQFFGASGDLHNRCVKPQGVVFGPWNPVEPAFRVQSEKGGPDGKEYLGRNDSRYALVVPESRCANSSDFQFGAYSCDSSDGQECRKIAGSQAFEGPESFDNALASSIIVVLALLQQNYDDAFTGERELIRISLQASLRASCRRARWIKCVEYPLSSACSFVFSENTHIKCACL